MLTVNVTFKCKYIMKMFVQKGLHSGLVSLHACTHAFYVAMCGFV